MLKAGGDSADGLIAYEGNWRGGDIFVSFDKQASPCFLIKGSRRGY